MSRFVVDDEANVLAVLRARGFAQKTAKDRIASGAVTVNGAPIAKANAAVAKGDVVVVGAAIAPRATLRGLTVLHADDDIVVVDKPAGLLSVAADGAGDETALTLARAALAARGRRTSKLVAVHRLDRETSGVLLLARSIDDREAIQARWRDDVEKKYVAIVEGHPDPPAARVALRLRELESMRVVVDAHHPDAKDAITSYTTTSIGPARAALDVALTTGRKHQIRVTLAHRGHPVVGDDVYGTADERLMLHAASLSFPHPSTGARLTFTSAPPAAFARALARSPSRAGTRVTGDRSGDGDRRRRR